MQYLTYISINAPSINQFISKTSKLLSEIQNFNQNFNLIVDAVPPPAIPTIAILLAEIFRWKIRLKRMYAVQNLEKYCPVNTLSDCISKTDPNASSLFNRCSKSPLSSPNDEPIWYTDTPIKHYQFTRFMHDISKNAKCSSTHTAHCLRATAIQEMNDAGIELSHIMHMSVHKKWSIRTQL